MAIAAPAFTVGIEEEYLLVDRETGDLASDPPASLMAECETLLEGQVSPELMRAQVEVGTRPFKTVREARADLAHLRGMVAQAAAHHGLAPIAASTHPFARWQDQQHVAKEALRGHRARPAGRRAAPAHLRHARPRRHRRRRPAHRLAEPDGLFSAASPDALDLVAVLGR